MGDASDCIMLVLLLNLASVFRSRCDLVTRLFGYLLR
jgi:hypothetical protein